MTVVLWSLENPDGSFLRLETWDKLGDGASKLERKDSNLKMESNLAYKTSNDRYRNRLTLIR